jgi:hypothetical protein
MKNCTHCKHAIWAKTAAGRLHPSGDGTCEFPLPACMYWINPPSGGYINRREELPIDCPYFTWEEGKQNGT